MDQTYSVYKASLILFTLYLVFVGETPPSHYGDVCTKLEFSEFMFLLLHSLTSSLSGSPSKTNDKLMAYEFTLYILKLGGPFTKCNLLMIVLLDTTLSTLNLKLLS